MTIKLRDAAAALKSATTFKIRDAANVLKSIPTIKMRDAANVLKTAFAAGGGGGGGQTVTIAPAVYHSSSATSHSNTSDFTATFGIAPGAIVWSIINGTGATGVILSGQGTATARIQLTVTGPFGSCVVRCAADGALDAASKQHTFTG